MPLGAYVELETDGPRGFTAQSPQGVFESALFTTLSTLFSPLFVERSLSFSLSRT